jgi:tetratricopeptide (TPR) repeat protein
LAGDYSSAEILCRKALRKPNLAVQARKLLSEVLYNQGVLQLRYGDLTNDAEKSFRAALEYNPGHVWASHNLGILKDHSGALDEAIMFYRNALRHDPKNVGSLQNLAASCQRAGYLEDAENAFMKLCVLDPSNAGLYLLRSAMQIESIIPDESYPDRVRSRMGELLDKCLQAGPISISPETYAAPYFYLSYHGKSNRELHEKLAKAYLHLCPSLAWEAPGARAPRKAGSRVKVGIVSPICMTTVLVTQHVA